MSILIRNMEMPKNCADCPLFEDKYHYHGCHAVPKSFNDMDMWNFVGDRPSWCPLIELPPQRRLIDADALRYWGNHIGDEDEHRFHDAQWIYRDGIDAAPTIIEAEENKNG